MNRALGTGWTTNDVVTGVPEWCEKEGSAKGIIFQVNNKIKW